MRSRHQGRDHVIESKKIRSVGTAVIPGPMWPSLPGISRHRGASPSNAAPGAEAVGPHRRWDEQPRLAARDPDPQVDPARQRRIHCGYRHQPARRHSRPGVGRSGGPSSVATTRFFLELQRWPHRQRSALAQGAGASRWRTTSRRAAVSSSITRPTIRSPTGRHITEMIGLAMRHEEFGPSLVEAVRRGRSPRSPTGEGRNPGHEPEHDFVVTVLDREHPITRGMPPAWLHPHEQLTHESARSGQEHDGPHLCLLEGHPGKRGDGLGRSRMARARYTTMLGHLWKNGPETAMRCVGFQTLLIR